MSDTPGRKPWRKLWRADLLGNTLYDRLDAWPRAVYLELLIHANDEGKMIQASGAPFTAKDIAYEFARLHRRPRARDVAGYLERLVEAHLLTWQDGVIHLLNFDQSVARTTPARRQRDIISPENRRDDVAPGTSQVHSSVAPASQLDVRTGTSQVHPSVAPGTSQCQPTVVAHEVTSALDAHSQSGMTQKSIPRIEGEGEGEGEKEKALPPNGGAGGILRFPPVVTDPRATIAEISARATERQALWVDGLETWLQGLARIGYLGAALASRVDIVEWWLDNVESRSGAVDLVQLAGEFETHYAQAGARQLKNPRSAFSGTWLPKRPGFGQRAVRVGDNGRTAEKNEQPKLGMWAKKAIQARKEGFDSDAEFYDRMAAEEERLDAERANG